MESKILESFGIDPGILIVAMFMKVEWKPIPHDSNVKITDLTDNAENIKEKQKIS